MKFSEQFDVKFGIGDFWGENPQPERKASGMVAEYAKAVLLGKGNLPEVTAEERAEVAEWHEKCKNLIAEGVRLAHEGVARDGLVFDNLKKRAKDLAAVYFGGSGKGLVVTKILEAYDAACNGVPPEPMPVAEPEPGPGDGKTWIQYPRLPLAEDKLLHQVQKFASWGDDHVDELEKCQNEFAESYPDDVGLLDDAKANGRLVAELKELAHKLAFEPHGKKNLETALSGARLPAYLEELVYKSFEVGRAAKKRAQEVRKLKCQARTQAAVVSAKSGKAPDIALPSAGKAAVELESDAGHPNSILGLRPAKKWMIVSDDTGTAFDHEPLKDGEKRGRYAFVLIPDYVDLPKLPKAWHACDERDPNVYLSYAETLHKSGCGILGVSVNGLYRTNRRLWNSCIEMLLDVTLRMLPVDGDTEIDLNVEQCGDNDKDSSQLLQKTLDDVMYHLSLVNPQKAAKIKLRARFIAKTDNRYNGYADLVAYSWGCNKSTKSLFRRFGWVGPCLIADDPATAKAFHRCLDWMRQDGPLSEADWSALVTSREASAVGSLIGGVLRAYGDEARADVAKWRTYLDYAMRHLDSKAIKMHLLGPQIAWLKEYEPDEASLPPRLRLLWLTAQLAVANHAGGISFGADEHAAEFRELCAKLKDEDAPLTCFAALHLAVEKTDSFEFDTARELLAPWENEPAAVPGLRYHAQVLSSLGQHAAFMGDNAKALDYFKRAMGTFTRLSTDWQRDFDQTCAYAVIAAMDSASPDLDRLFALYLYGGEPNPETMVDMANQLAGVGEDEPNSKYAHAILLRYLVKLPSDHPVRKAYMASESRWQWCEDGHPWELIAFYRALLLGNTPAAVEWLRRGYALCAHSGPTLRCISCVLLGALLAWNAADQAEYLAKVEEVASLLPALGADRLAALRAHADTPGNPLELAAKVLPFNFR